MNDEQTPALRQAVENMATMREAYDNLSQAAESYNTGKTELAANITAKGVQASASETLPELAEKVSAIAQQPIILSPSEVGDMYAVQQFGSLTTPNYWNLYEVLNTLLNDGRLLNYGGILLAEYYRGYDSLALSGAGAGGAYVVSDMENGQFKMYTEDTTHTWATEFDGKGNRWVAYCFADAGHNFDITDTNTSPRSIHIGRHVGKIGNLTNGRIADIVVTDGNLLDSFTEGRYSNNFGRKVVFNNFGVLNNRLLNISKQTEIIYLKCDKIDLADYNGFINDDTNRNLRALIVECNEIRGRLYMGGTVKNSNITIILKVKKIVSTNYASSTIFGVDNMPFTLLGFEEGDFSCYNCNVPRIYIGYDTNDKTKSISVSPGIGNFPAALTDIELQDGWCKPLNITTATSLTKQNVQNHIFDRLGVNDISTGTVTITLASAVLALFTQEEIDAVVERTNITIVGA